MINEQNDKTNVPLKGINIYMYIYVFLVLVNVICALVY